MEEFSFDHLLLQEFLDDGDVEAVLHEFEGRELGIIARIVSALH